MDDVERLLRRVEEVTKYALMHPMQPRLKTHPRDCWEHVEVTQVRQRGNGTVSFVGICDLCGTILHPWLTRKQAEHYLEMQAVRLELASSEDGLGICYAVDCTAPATVDHHILPVRDFGQKKSDEGGTVPYCEYHHQQAHRRYGEDTA